MSYVYHLAFPKCTHQVTEVLLSVNSLQFYSVILIQSRNNTSSRIPSTTGNAFVYLFIPRSANHRFFVFNVLLPLLSKTKDSRYYTIPTFCLFFFSPPTPRHVSLWFRDAINFTSFTYLSAYGLSWILEVEWDPAGDDSPSGAVPALPLPLRHCAGSGGSAGRKGQAGLLADPQLSETPAGCPWGCKEDACEGQARPDGVTVCVSLPHSPLPVIGWQRAPDPRMASPGHAEAAHTRQRGVGLLNPASCSPDVAEEPPSVHRAEAAVCFIPTKTETHPSLQEFTPQSQKTMMVLFSSKKNARGQRKEISCHLFLPANIAVFQRKGNV